MIFSPGTFGRLLGGGSRWALAIGRHAADGVVHLYQGAPYVAIPLIAIQCIRVQTGAIWADLQLVTDKTTHDLNGLTNDDARQLKRAVEELVRAQLASLISANKTSVERLTKALTALLNEERYLAARDLATLGAAHGDAGAAVAHPLFDATLLPAKQQQQLVLLTEMLAPDRRAISARNERFVEQELERHASYFDTIESQPLTVEQRKAAVVLEDCNLVVAAAGSGKTSVIVAKVGYLVRTRFCAPEEILILAFNRDAQQELAQRIEKRLGETLGGRSPTVKTFHALGLDILTEANDRKVLVDKVATDGEAALRKFIEAAIAELAETDKQFRRDWMHLAIIYADPVKEPGDFKSRAEYEDYERQFRVQMDGRWGHLTIRGELVKSMQERMIANWLALEGIDYEYERPYAINTATRQYRQYQPDFYYPDTGTYHEHFALNARNEAPSHFSGDYLAGVAWKRQLHQDNHTDLIETTSAMFSDGTWSEHLDGELTRRGVKRRKRTAEEQKALARKALAAQSNLVTVIGVFLKHAKSVDASPDELEAKAIETGKARPRAFVKVFNRIRAHYQAYLQSRHSVDFEDLITQSQAAVVADRYRHRYKAILVDEFQDISQGRARLLQALLAQKTDCKLVAVGDDWQAIYRFAGADIDIMTRFADHFGITERLFLTRTFRCHQSIAETGSRFVMKNPAQIPKTVVSENRGDQRTVRILRGQGRDQIAHTIAATLARINQMAKERGKPLSVFLLGRYRLLQPDHLGQWRRDFDGLHIEFKTIHGSKGLEADYVFVLGLVKGAMRFLRSLQTILCSPWSFPDRKNSSLQRNDACSMLR